MIQLIRVYSDERVIAAEAYDHDERTPDHRHPLERCRCIPVPLWQSRTTLLTHEYPGCEITVTPIYLSKGGPHG